MSEPIRVFIGCAANHEDAESQAVLEWTIRKNTSRPVEIHWMKLSRDPESPWYSDNGEGWNTKTWATPFSGFRWAIPELCGFEGKAIYMDSDMIVMEDLAELWDQPHPTGTMLLAKAGGQWRICVSMWDCAAAKGRIPSLEAMRADPNAHQNLCHKIKNSGFVAPFSGEWNCLDREIGGRELTHPSIKIIHYTDMRSQPQIRHAVPRLQAVGRAHWFDGATTPNRFKKINKLFDSLLAEAAENGYGVENYLTDPLYGPYKKKSYKR